MVLFVYYTVYIGIKYYRAVEVIYWEAKVFQNFSRIQSPALD